MSNWLPGRAADPRAGVGWTAPSATAVPDEGAVDGLRMGASGSASTAGASSPADSSPSPIAPSPPAAVGSAPPASASRIDEPEGWKDELTGLDGPALWELLVVREMARSARYGRPATVVIVEAVGISELAARFGPEFGQVALRAAARSLREGARTSDLISRIGPTRFGVLLPETDEIAAINFVERVRAAGPLPEPGAAATLEYAFGWSSAVRGEDTATVLGRAERRLAAELRSKP